MIITNNNTIIITITITITITMTITITTSSSSSSSSSSGMKDKKCVKMWEKETALSKWISFLDQVPIISIHVSIHK